MVIGTIKEVKDNENRVGLTPVGVKALVADGHRAVVQRGAGVGSGFSDSEYEESGAILKESAREVAEEVDMLVKIKEPLPLEYDLLSSLEGKILFTYLHLSGVDKGLTLKLLENRITAIAYETVENELGDLPLLKPMSEIAGVLAVQYGAEYLQKKYGGRGVTLGMIEDADLAHTVIVGAGVVGAHAARTAIGMGGKVTVLNRSMDRLDALKQKFTKEIGKGFLKRTEFLESTYANLRAAVEQADLLVGAVLVHGARAPEVVTEEMVGLMKPGAVIVDVSVDQGGCIWGTKPTTHSDPIYDIDGKIFCCVANMPGQVARQATQALTSVTLPYVKRLAESGAVEALRESLNFDDGFAKGVNTFQGKICYEQVAEDLNLMSEYVSLMRLIQG